MAAIYRLSSCWQTSIADVHCCDTLVLVVAYSLAKLTDTGLMVGVDDVVTIDVTAGTLLRGIGLNSLHHLAPCGFDSPLPLPDVVIKHVQLESRVDDRGNAQLFVCHTLSVRPIYSLHFGSQKDQNRNLILAVKIDHSFSKVKIVPTLISNSSDYPS